MSMAAENPMTTNDEAPRSNGGAEKASTLSILGRLSGAIGLVLLVSMILTWILTQDVGGLLIGKLCVGLAGVAFYLMTNLDFFRRVAGGRSAGLLLMTVLSTGIVLGLVGIGNYIGYQSALEWDMTREGIHTLSPQTTTVLSRLQDDVKIIAFYSTSETTYPLAEDVLHKYTRASGRVHYEVVDPQARPDLVQQYQITDAGPRVVVIAKGQDTRAKRLNEQEITRAIIAVAEETVTTFHYLTGHGEPKLDDGESAEGYKGFADAVVAEGYLLKPVSLIDPKGRAGAAVNLKEAAGGTLALPPEVLYLIVSGSRSALLKPELQAIANFLKRGGRLLAQVEPHILTGLERLLGDLGIAVRADMVVDPNPLNRMIGLGAGAPMVVPTDEKHPITKGLTVTAVMSTARSLGVQATAPGSGLTMTLLPLMRAGASAWGETAVNDGMAEQGPDDNQEDLYVGVVATAPTEQLSAEKISNQARIVAFGDSDWINNHYLPMQGNKDLILNTLNWLATREDRITIRPKIREASQFSLHGEQLNYLKFFSMDILPVLLIAMGLGVVLIRRQR
jgi:hypothetical protein